MDPVTISIGVVVISALLIKRYRSKRKKEMAQEMFIAALLEEGEQLKSMSEAMEHVAKQNVQAYMKEAPDLVFEDKCTAVLKELFPEGFEAGFVGLNSEDQKKELIRGLVSRLSKELGVQINAIRFEQLEPAHKAAYRHNDEEYGKTIIINRLSLTDSPEELIFYVLHELKHAVQVDALTEGNKPGYSDQRLAQWLVSFDQYYDGANCTRAYELQANELDANLFAAAVIDKYVKSSK